MSFTVKYRISQEDGAKPKFNIAKIVEGIVNEGWHVEELENVVILTVKLPFEKTLFEIKRRLAAKRNRRGTLIQILSKEGVPNGK